MECPRKNRSACVCVFSKTYRRHAVSPLSMAGLQPLHSLDVIQHPHQLAYCKRVHLKIIQTTDTKAWSHETARGKAL